MLSVVQNCHGSLKRGSCVLQTFIAMPGWHQVDFTCCTYTQGNETVTNDTCRRYFEPCALMLHALIMMEVYSLVRHAHL